MQSMQHASSNNTHNNNTDNNNNAATSSGGNASLPMSSRGAPTSYQQMQTDSASVSRHHMQSSGAVDSSCAHAGSTLASGFKSAATTAAVTYAPSPLAAPRKPSAVSIPMSTSNAVHITPAPTSPVTPHALTGPTLLSYPSAVPGVHSPITRSKGVDGNLCTAVCLPPSHTEPVLPRHHLSGHPSTVFQSELSSTSPGNKVNETRIVSKLHNSGVKEKRSWSSVKANVDLSTVKPTAIKTEVEMIATGASSTSGTVCATQRNSPSSTAVHHTPGVPSTAATTTATTTPRSPQSVASNDVRRMLAVTGNASATDIRSPPFNGDGTRSRFQNVRTGRVTQLSSAVEGMTIVPRTGNSTNPVNERTMSNETSLGVNNNEVVANGGAHGSGGSNGNMDLGFHSEEFLVGQCGGYGSNGLLDEISGDAYGNGMPLESSNGEADGMVMFH